MENMRGLAIAMVVLGHLTSIDSASSRWLSSIYYFLFSNATAIFVFISGFFFFYTQNGRFVPVKYILGRYRSIFIPYFLLNSFAISFAIYRGTPADLELGPVGYYFWSMLIGGSAVGPLWFIPMIMLYIALSPVAYRIASWRIFPMLTLMAVAFSCLSSRPFLNANPLYSATHFLGFYLLGIYFSRNLDALLRVRLYLAALGVAFFLLASVTPAVELPGGFFDKIGTLNPAQLGKLGVLLWLFSVMSKSYDQKSIALGLLSKYSFSIFFLHGFWLFVFSQIPYALLPKAGFIFLFQLLVVMLGVAGTVWVAKRILKGNSKYVIGA